MKRPTQPADDRHWPRIVELERELDPMIRSRGPEEPLNPRLLAAVREWSAAVWATAESLRPSPPPPSELSRGIRLAQRPVFVCGAARSGTTLLRDLLDGHPQLAVVPTESLFYTHLARALFDLRPDRHRSYLGCRWLERLVAPPPYWLLGCSALGESPYVTFARDFTGWWQVTDHVREARQASWPLAAFALAYAQWLGGGRVPRDAQMWVEKTPSSEQFLQSIWHDFPAAKVIHIVREPQAALASIKAMKGRQRSRGHALMHVIRYMAASYRIAAYGARHLPKERYRLIRYEDLTASPDAIMAEIAEFLGIELNPSLLQPTVAGRRATNNTSFGTSRPDPQGVLDPVECGLLTLLVGRPAARLGYGPLEISSPGKHRIVGGLAQGQGADALTADGVPPHVEALTPGDRFG